MYFKTLLCLSFLVLSSLKGMAENAQLSKTESQNLRKTANFLVNEILKSGTTEIGSIDLTKLQQEIETVDFIKTENKQFAQGREFLRYDTTKRQVFIPVIDFQLSDSEAAYILLHETLGALGYEDDKYQISSLIYLFAYSSSGSSELLGKQSKTKVLNLINRTDAFKKQKRTQNPITIENRINLNKRGGVTGAGGGGDPHAAMVKSMSIMLMILINDERFTDDFIIWFNSHFGIETYKIDSEVNGKQDCNLDNIDKLFISEINLNSATVYYPSSCSILVKQKMGSYGPLVVKIIPLALKIYNQL